MELGELVVWLCEDFVLVPLAPAGGPPTHCWALGISQRGRERGVEREGGRKISSWEKFGAGAPGYLTRGLSGVPFFFSLSLGRIQLRCLQGPAITAWKRRGCEAGRMQGRGSGCVRWTESQSRPTRRPGLQAALRS